MIRQYLSSRKPDRNLPGTCLKPPIVGFQQYGLQKGKISGVSNPQLILCSAGNTAKFGLFASFPVFSRQFSGCSIIDAPHSMSNVNENRIYIRLHKHFGYIVSFSLCKCKLNRPQNRICAHRRILLVGP